MEVATQAKQNSAKKQMILGIIEAKKNADLQNMSIEDLTALAESL